MGRALITGCSKGVGWATAMRLALDGWDVVATMRSRERGDQRLLDAAAVAGVALTVQQLDTTDDRSVQQAFDSAGQIDLLVNNAAISNIGSVEETTLADWRQMLETNLLGTIRCMQAVLPGMRIRRSGCIINVTTVAVRAAFPGTGAYAASKAAIEHVSEVVAIEARPFGIRVVVVEPGALGTDMQPTGTPPGPDSPYWPTMRNTIAYLTANATRASHPDVVADAIARAAADVTTPFRIAVGQAAPETLELRRQHTDDEWHELLSSREFRNTYQPPQTSLSGGQADAGL